MKYSAIALAAAAAISPVVAELAVTRPIEGTTCQAGQPCTISWRDNRSGPSLEDQGDCQIALFTGGSQQQTFLQPIAFPTPINVAEQDSISFIPDPTVGENGDVYFIRFTSQDLRNPTAATQPYLSFSARFTLTGMTGTFNATVQAQIEQGTAPPSGAPSRSSASRTGSSTPAESSTPASRTVTRTPSSSSTADSGSMRVGAGVGAVVLGLMGLVGLAF